MEPTTQEILDKMQTHDAFSQWLGLVVDEYRVGYCRLHYTVRPDMVNGFGIVHGGVVFAAADSAFAFACNSQGVLSVALDVHVVFIKAGKPGDVFTVEAKEIHTGNKTGFYDIVTTNEAGQIVSTFRGTAYRTGKSVV